MRIKELLRDNGEKFKITFKDFVVGVDAMN